MIQRQQTSMQPILLLIRSKTPIIWIVGGIDKGNDYHELLPLGPQKSQRHCLFGKK